MSIFVLFDVVFFSSSLSSCYYFIFVVLSLIGFHCCATHRPYIPQSVYFIQVKWLFEWFQLANGNQFNFSSSTPLQCNGLIRNCLSHNFFFHRIHILYLICRFPFYDQVIIKTLLFNKDKNLSWKWDKWLCFSFSKHFIEIYFLDYHSIWVRMDSGHIHCGQNVFKL